MSARAWWPCFVCGSEALCPHREPEIVVWMANSAGVARVLATLPPAALAIARRPPGLAASGAAGAQGELFALERRAR